MNGESVKREKVKGRGTSRVAPDEILLEYDFSRVGPNKDAARYAKGSIVVTLDPDVAAIFPSAGKANEVLRELAGIMRSHRPGRAR